VLEINFENLSPYAKAALKKTDGKKTYKDIKLMSTLHDKTNYVLHAKNLALYLQLGLKLKKIHKVLEFEQEKIFEPYIEKTTDARKKAHSKFEMDMFKKLVSHITFTVNRLYSCLLVSNYEFFFRATVFTAKPCKMSEITSMLNFTQQQKAH
jgi:hypothetical protein